MNIAEFSVNRPVTTIMFYLGVVLLGVVCIVKMPRELFPSIVYPQLSIVTRYGNAAPEEVETLISKLIEESVGTVANIQSVTSRSKEGVSIVTTQFAWDTNMDFAALALREKIDLVKSRLPRDSDEPIVVKYNPYDLPIIVLSVRSQRSPDEVLRLTKKFIKEGLEKVEGVAACMISGGRKREIQVDVDHFLLRSKSIGLKSISEALSNANLNYPAGVIKEQFFELLIRTMGEYEEISEIPLTPIVLDDREQASDEEKKYLKGQADSTGAGGRIIRLSDVAKVIDGLREKDSYSRYNIKENISISIQKQAQANIVKSAFKVRKELDKIRSKLPEDFEIDVVYDQSEFIKKSIGGVTDAVWQGGLISFLVLLFFLGNLKSASIVSVSIPISVMVTFILMYFNGVTINMMSLAGLALGIGMMVDNAIVVLENIDNRKKQFKPKQAIVKGTTEMTSSVISSTFTTIAVFLPMVFVVGIAGQIFRDLSFTVNFSLLASLIVSLSLVPRLSLSESDYLEGQRKNRLVAFIESFFKLLYIPVENLVKVYPLFLKIALKYFYLVIIVSVVLFCLAGWGLSTLEKEMMPKIDQGEFTVKVSMPTGTVVERTNEITERIEKKLFNYNEVDTILTRVSSTKSRDKNVADLNSLDSHQAEITVSLLRINGDFSSRSIVNRLKSDLKDENLLGASVEYIVRENLFSLSPGISAPIVLEVKGHDMLIIKSICDRIVDKLKKIPGTSDVKSHYPESSPEMKINVDKERATLYGVSVTDVATALNTALKGTVSTRFKQQGREIDVLVRLQSGDRNTFERLNYVTVYSKELKKNIPIRLLTRIQRGYGPSEIYRNNQSRTVIISSEVLNRSLKEVMEDVSHLIEVMPYPLGYTVEFGGEKERMNESFQSMQLALILSLILVYMIMASQFESIWKPFIILFTVPLSIIGVFMILFVTNSPLNVVVILGIIMLGGIVVNNGIVLISYGNERIAEGKSPFESAMEAGQMRIRPILMTTATTVLGLIPLALGLSEGAEMQQPMAITVMGGLSVSTFLTLFVIPCLFYASESFVDRFVRKKKTPRQPIEMTL